MAFRVATEEPIGEGLRRAARDQLDGAVDSLGHDLAADPEGAVHDARKRLKKVRALLRLAQPAIGRKARRRENDALRDAGRALSGARDADVLARTLDDLAERNAGRLPAASFGAARASLAPGTGARPAGPSPAVVDDALAAIRAARDRVEDWPLSDTTGADVLAGLGRAYARGRDERPRAGDRPTIDELHDWRKRVKDLWYHQRLLRDAWTPVLRAQAEEAHLLSELLGDDHDLAVLRERLLAAPLADPRADATELVALVDQRRAELLDEAVALGARVYAEKPKAHAARHARYVRAWRAA